MLLFALIDIFPPLPTPRILPIIWPPSVKDKLLVAISISPLFPIPGFSIVLKIALANPWKFPSIDISSIFSIISPELPIPPTKFVIWEPSVIKRELALISISPLLPIASRSIPLIIRLSPKVKRSATSITIFFWLFSSDSKLLAL